MKYIFVYALLLPLFSIGQSISGVVLNEKKTPLPGATVIHSRTSQQTQTNELGIFKISDVSPVDTLIISMIGYETYRQTGIENDFLSIVLKSKITELGEVLFHTGYESLPKERATGAFETVTESLFNQQVSTNILSRLEGIVSSLTVDKKTNQQGISIRGLSSINGPRSPLIILDNFPYAGNLDNINPNDVENITILKDAAAASIWGAQAGNGVIVITTKNSRLNQPLTIKFTSNFTTIQKPDLFYLRHMAPSEYIEVESLLFDKNYRFGDTSANHRPLFTPLYEILFQKKNGQITDAEANDQINRLRNTDIRNQLDKYVYKAALNQQYSLNLSGGAARVSYLFSAGADQNKDVLNATFSRINLNLKNSFKIHQQLTLNTAIYYTKSKNTSGRPSYLNLNIGSYRMPLYTPLADENGNPVAVGADIRQGFKDTAGNGRLLDWNYYPLDDYNHSISISSLSDIIFNAGLQYQIIPSLSAKVQYQYEFQTEENKTQYGVKSYHTRNLINRFSEIDPQTGQVDYHIPIGAILNKGINITNAYNLRGQLNYKQTYYRHAIHALAGSEVREFKTTFHSNRIYGINEQTGTTVNVDNVNRYLDYITSSPSLIPGTNSLGYSLNRFISFFTNAAYTYADKYTWSFSARKDASNMFGLETNDKWNPLWSSGISWDISREKFYKLKILPELKFRATLGYSGNVDQGRTAATTLVYLGVSQFTLMPYAGVNNFANPSLRWEKVRMINLAADFSTFNNRISGSIEYFIKKAEDLYGSIPVDYTTGVGNSITKNIAAMKGRGIDATILIKVVDKKWSWSINTFLNYYKDKVTHYYVNSLKGSNFLGNSITAIEGHPVYGVYAYKWEGLDATTGDPQGITNDQLSKNYNELTGNNTLVTDLVYAGPLFPTITGAFANTFSYKGLSLTVRLNYKLGHFYRMPSLSYSSLINNGIGDMDYSYRWQKPGDELLTHVPSFIYPNVSNRDAFYNGSAIHIRKADHVRLKYINAEYEKPIKNKTLKEIRFFVTVSDIGILWSASKNKIDPEYPNGILPPTINWSTGIGIKF